MSEEIISIGGIKYSLIYVDKLMDEGHQKLNGHIKYGQTEIIIESSLSEQCKLVTLCHEAIHAILIHAGVDVDEKIIEILGYGVCGFIQENRTKLLDLMLKSASQ